MKLALRVVEREPAPAPDEQKRSLDGLGLRPFEESVRVGQGEPLRALEPSVLQINVGKVCNQTCLHCHVDAGPHRRESMSQGVMDACLRYAERPSVRTVDITGGAPEMHPRFRWLVEQSRRLDKHVIDRCNLTIMDTPTHRDLPEFFARHQVEVVCSLPHYRAPSTDRQRGDGVFHKSIKGLRALNAVGYGQGDPERRLVLVMNPVGAYLPGSQETLERDWKRELWRLHGVTFDELFCITNMPISRYLSWLEESGNLRDYMEKLVQQFNPATLDGLMCRTTLSVGWDGLLYDCDFNQMLDLTVESGARRIEDMDGRSVGGRRVVVGQHCFGCTAGAGSSCGGETTG